jgi:hypothetical protein
MLRAHLVSAINLIFLLKQKKKKKRTTTKKKQAFYNVLIMFRDHVKCTLRGKRIVDC